MSFQTIIKWRPTINICTLNVKRCICTEMSVYNILNEKPLGKIVSVKGWIQNIIKTGASCMIELYDASSVKLLPIILKYDKKSLPTFGSCIKVDGYLVENTDKQYKVELLAQNWRLLGLCPKNNPIQSNVKDSYEYSRKFPHLRAQTKAYSTILRLSSAASWAIHKFFKEERFFCVFTPILTQNDCEGGGDAFLVEKSQNSTTFIDDRKNFFGSPTYLSVSGQLHLEALTRAGQKVYTFGPVFRAEPSKARHHLCEFHMIETDIAFIENVEELIKLCEKFIKYVAQYLIENCYDELKIVYDENDLKLDYLERMIANPMPVLSYDHAVEILKCHQERLKVPIREDGDFTLSHKLYLSRLYNSWVFINMLPSNLKPFFVKEEVETKKAFAFDLFNVIGGEIASGSIRKDFQSMEHLFLEENPIVQHLEWYSEIHKFGGVPHGGFGVGFERLLQALLGIKNIRDIIPFPRRKYDCKC